MQSPPTKTFSTSEKTGSDAVKPVAVVDIGATSIRMAIAEIRGDGKVRTLERLAQAVSLGKDTFAKGSIDTATIEDCVRVLTSYRQLLNEYGITNPDQIHVVATSAVREAANRLTFLKRIYVATGFNVEPFDEAAVNRVTYLGTQPLLQSHAELLMAETLIVEVGGGSTEVLLFQQGDVAYANTYRLGALRLRKTLEAFRTPTGKFRDMMERQIQRIVDQVSERVPHDSDMKLIALGGDMRFAITKLFPDREPGSLTEVPLAELRQFTEKILDLNVDEVVRKYRLPFPDAEALGPALLTYVQLAGAFELQSLLVSNINLRDGLIKAMALRETWTESFVDQIIHSAISFGRRFGFDEDHGRNVADLSRRLFRDLESVHQLDARHEVILYVAALLHDIGYAVSARSHHKHSMYLIENGELFGLSRKDVVLAALTARYHRRATPKVTHERYNSLDWASRIDVAKMAAMLRIADALDRSNSQRIRDIRCAREKDRLVISVPIADDLSLEQISVRQKSNLFKDVFGMTVTLKNSPSFDER